MESIFFYHLLPQKNLEPLTRTTDPQIIWPSLYLFVCLIILVLIKPNSFSALITTVQNTFSFKGLKKIERDDSGQLKLYSLALGLFFMLNLSFLAYRLNIQLELILVDRGFLSQFLFFFSVILLVSIYKFLIHQFLIFATNETKVIIEYSSISTSSNQTAGLILFPLMVMNAFSSIYPQFNLYIALITLGSILLLKWSKGIVLGLIEERIGLLQIFTYFCTLEILPSLIVVKYIIETF